MGWYVAYRERNTGKSRRHRFGIREKEREREARILYHKWVSRHLGGKGEPSTTNETRTKRKSPASHSLSGSLIEIASGLISSERSRVRKEGEPRRRGTIDPRVFTDRKKQIRDYLTFLNDRHGSAAVARMRLADLSMEDVEDYNRSVASGYSASQVAKRMQIVKAIIDRAGRPEHGGQVLSWNWESRDVAHGAPTRERPLPTVKQLKALLEETDFRGKTMIWLGIGLGLGAKDLAAIRVGQIIRNSYDLRRGKTGIERYGDTPPLVWAHVNRYQREFSRPKGQLLLVTRNGEPLVHGSTNAVALWWNSLRTKIGEKKNTLAGFYTLRHLGATEFGSRPGTSISNVKRWLGHAASSGISDLYMRPVRPEYHEVVGWVRKKLRISRIAR